MRSYRSKLAVFGLYAALVAGWAAVSLWMPNGYLRELVTVLWLLFAPGFTVWRALVSSRNTKLNYHIGGYIVGMSLLLLMVVGLLLNGLYTVVGVSGPLNRTPLTVAISLAVLMFGGVAAFRAKGFPKLTFSFKKLLERLKPDPLTVSMITAGLLLPVLSIAGAVTLNNGGNAGLADVTMISSALLFVLVLLHEQQLGKYYGYTLYCICASILFATSMRGWNITGHDVMQEYQVFQLTLSHASWHMSYYHDAYTACLSLTILPTLVQKISGFYAPYIFKFVFQAIAALIAVVLYGSLRQYATRRVALLATFLFVTFPTFLTDMPMLNRQEMGFLFFALAMHIGTNRQISKLLRSTLVFCFMVGMILSHYSTSYVAIGSLLVAYVVAYAWRYGARLLHRPHVPDLSRFTSIVSPLVLAASILVLITWGTIITQTSNNIKITIKEVAASAQGEQPSSGTLLSLRKPTASQFSTQALKARPLPASSYYSEKLLSKYPLRAAKETVQPPSSITRFFHIPGAVLSAGYDKLRGGYALLIEASFGLGLLYFLFAKRTPKSLPRQYVLLALGFMVFIGLQVVMPSAIDYGLTRLLQQALLLFALPSVLVALGVLRLFRVSRHIAEITVGIIITGFFLVLSGVLPSISGGYKPSLTSANSGFYYTAYYTHQDEIAAAQWLARYPTKGSQMYSDEFMRRKLITYGGVFPEPVLAPTAIPTDSYVILGYGNLKFDQVPAYDNGTLIYYKPPLAFLRQNKNLVYSADSVQIYK